MTKKICCITITLMLFSFFAKAQYNESIINYIKTYCGIAVVEMQRTGVPAAIKLAQGIHESMAGNSPLVIQSNNHFGIKCKEGYNGPYVLHDDDRPKERFMKYESANQSFKDHSDFLKTQSRYAFLFQMDPTDYKSWAYGLKKAGYATNPKYPQLLIQLIEKYNLADYTLMGLGQIAFNDDVKQYMSQTQNSSFTNTHSTAQTLSQYPSGDFLINYTKVVYAKPGSSLANIANTYHISLEQLRSLNDFGSVSEPLQKGTLVFLQLKRTVCNKDYHHVIAGESWYDIAQAEGIRLSSLLKLNNASPYNNPVAGTSLKLRNNISSIAKN